MNIYIIIYSYKFVNNNFVLEKNGIIRRNYPIDNSVKELRRFVNL